jgi:hypothetical protein
MKFKKLYEDRVFNKLLNHFGIPNYRKIEKHLEELGIKNYKILENGLVNVNGDVNISRETLFEIPVQFGKVTGNFDCSNNHILHLRGAPKEVGGNFNCSNNIIESLKDAPEKIGGNFNCSRNKLTSLKNSPEKVGGDFDCTGNKIKAHLTGITKEIGGKFKSSNKLLNFKYEESLNKEDKEDKEDKENKEKIYSLTVQEIVDHYYKKDRFNAIKNINSYIRLVKKDPKINMANLLKAKEILKLYNIRRR